MNFQELKEIALKNPKGKIVAKDATGNDINNTGTWKRTDCTVDEYRDIKEAVNRLSGKPLYIIGSHDTLESVCKSVDPYSGSKFIYEFLSVFFWFSTDKFPNYEMAFIRFDDTADPGIVLLVGSGDRDVVYIDTL